jgi:hypothetical protein
MGEGGHPTKVEALRRLSTGCTTYTRQDSHSSKGTEG